MPKIKILKPLVERSQMVNELPNSEPFYMHISLLDSFQTGDILIFPDKSIIYEYDELLPAVCYPERKHKVAFVVCKLLRSSGEEIDFHFYPLEMNTVFYKLIKNPREIDYDTTFTHSIDGMKASDWFSKQLDKRNNSLRNRFLSPFEGHAYYVSVSKPVLTWRSSNLTHGCSGYSNILSFTTLDKETTDKFIANHHLKNEMFNLKKKVNEIKKQYKFGFLEFMKSFRLEEPFSDSDYYTVITFEEQIVFCDAKYRAEKIMMENPWGFKTYYKDKSIDTHSLLGYRDVINNACYIVGEQGRYNELQKIKKLEPKYAKSPYIDHINIAMDRKKENYFEECDMVEILFNYSNKYDILAVFGNSLDDIVESEINDTHAYRTNPHYFSGFCMKYDKGIIRENLIRKIIDNIEKYKTENL